MAVGVDHENSMDVLKLFSSPQRSPGPHRNADGICTIRSAVVGAEEKCEREDAKARSREEKCRRKEFKSGFNSSSISSRFSFS
jgi:hypothetical protein